MEQRPWADQLRDLINATNRASRSSLAASPARGEEPHRSLRRRVLRAAVLHADRPSWEEMFTIDPPPAARIAGMAALDPGDTPVALTVITCVHAASVVSANAADRRCRHC
jgi:hypothetical protein